MRRLRQLAERTPPGRERYVDLLRALAITMVVLGHWGVTVIERDAAGRPTGHSALGDLPWAYPLTWVAQVMPVFFLVGGYANAASLTRLRARGGDAAGWLVDRSARLVRPTTVLVLVLSAAAAVARLLDADPIRIREVVWFATIPLWFLVAYLAVVALTPPMYALHRRFGLAVPLVLIALVGIGDLGRLTGPEQLGYGNYLFGWLAVHQLGFAWHHTRAAPPGVTDAAGPAAPGRPGVRRRRLPTSRRTGLVFLAGGLAALLLLTVLGPWPVAMLHVPGERLDNAAPPSLALLAVAATQLGLILLLRGPAERLLRRTGPWQLVIGVNLVVLTVFLWHLTAAVLLIGLLDATGTLPTPAVGSAAWWAWRVPWLLLLAVVLAVLVAIFGPVEARSSRHRTGRRAGRGTATRTALTVAGYAAVVAALLFNSATPARAPEPLGTPVPALLAYLAGAGVLRLLRSGWGTRG
ncbi:Peptidoglycan/LPS O-acetylase OafA/YrhL, contains acyltransferase and SGNH-hydrolase domains [Micromonospora coriariae]|uniref:Peptidoglycan/LPS O-acetylase OafA/YrhL, contains acyltransferase and SGNH-hydrolase domains n=1 Tax=Micromonospora coriariae TaxID=285665 RepID=A0A1C4X0S9_9ACTN|nr:acyltransferase [Micromonospora coriariae]SCF02049.1 Peptidoglycan/LPS O-acetylase OafA/YrhL, contains acyltransferase and SGNH-hydrolase domains [Micromonospora coriariae]